MIREARRFRRRQRFLGFVASIAVALVLSSARMALAADGDGDGMPDEIDPCTTTLIMYWSSVTLRDAGINPDVDDEDLVLKGIFSFPTEMQNVDLNATGMHILLYSDDAEVLSEVVIPPGLPWRTDRETIDVLLHTARFDFSDATRAYGGIRRIRIDGASSPLHGFIKFRIVARNGSYPVSAADIPLRVAVVLGNGEIGECGYAPHWPGECAFNAKGERLRCKRHRIRGD